MVLGLKKAVIAGASKEVLLKKVVYDKVNLMKNKKVKIVATIGPSTHSPEMIKKLAQAGVDVFRLNLSHQRRDNVIDVVKIIREIEKGMNKPLSIMGDLGGLKVRLGKIADNTLLETGQMIKISTEPVVGSKEIFSINYPSIVEQLKSGTEILIDDGLIKLVVIKELMNDTAQARVEAGGLLLSHKGLYAQGLSLLDMGMPEKDKEDIKLLADVQADAIAVSFVQTKYDIERVRERLPVDSNMVLIAKIETQQAVENIEKIVDVADGVMVARGDLGLAVPIAQVPLLQKKIIALCLKKAKPVITATQMLESMTKSPFPTRPEVTDVANAILDGTDAVMLSGETATGKYPLQTVEMMSKIIETVSPHIQVREFHDETEIANAVSSAAGLIADKVGARMILAFTKSGFSALQIARHRYSQEVIVALSPNKKTLRKLNFCWGVYPQYIGPTESFDHVLEQAKEFVQNNDIINLKKGESYVIVAGLPFNRSGTTNLIYVDKA